MTGIYHLDMAIGLFLLSILITILVTLDARRGDE